MKQKFLDECKCNYVNKVELEQNVEMKCQNDVEVVNVIRIMVRNNV